MFEGYTFASDNLLAQIRQRIEECPVAHLITIGPEGFPHARGMEDHNVGEDFIFYFATDAHTRKITEIQADPRVCVAYYHPASGDYICVFGRAEVVSDEVTRTAQWCAGWECYWPGGPSDPRYRIIRIQPEALEYFDMHEQQLKAVKVPPMQERGRS